MIRKQLEKYEETHINFLTGLLQWKFFLCLGWYSYMAVRLMF